MNMNISGLSTDIFFIAAIKSNNDLMEILAAHDIYNNVANPDYDMDNVALPYIIVNNDGGNNNLMSKDEEYEGDEDKVNISVRIVAKNRKQLDDLATEVRRTVNQYIREMESLIEAGEEPDGYELKPSDYTFSFSDISYDMLKPSHTIMLYYNCDVRNNQ